MNKILILVGVVVIGIIASAYFFIPNDESVESISVYDAGFTYYDIELIQDTLAKHNVIVSAPTAITDNTIGQYCTYFEKGLPRTVDYCTTTAVVISDGSTIGNINIGGDTTSPVMAVANLETSSLESDQAEVLAVFETMIETLVCDCWEEEQSGEYESIAAWLDAVHTFHTDSNNRNIKSKIDNLSNVEIILEVTAKDDSVLQTLIILK